MRKMKKSAVCVIIFLSGGYLYCTVELVARGFSHISMFLAGGMCMLLVGGIRRVLPEISFLSQMVLSGALITLVELAFGLVVNQRMKLEVWDYSQLPYNFRGQICLLEGCLWVLLSAPAILVHDFLWNTLLGIPWKNYRIF